MTDQFDPNRLIEPDQLLSLIESDAQEDLLIVDLGQAQLYDRVHVPTAVHLPFGGLTSGIKPATGRLPELAQLESVLAGVGYTPDKLVVAYDDEGGGWAGRLLWTLDLLGHKPSMYLNGGIHYWMHKKLPLQQGGSQSIETTTSLKLEIKCPELEVDKAYIQERLEQDSLTIWDARSPEEYNGQRCFARRGGRIPGAVNYEWTNAMDRQNGLALRPLDDIRQELSDLGITQDKEIITHCQTHHRSGFTYLLGKILGFEHIKAYSGSWADWGNDLTVPIESEYGSS